jgi:hypothetical protein
VKARRYATAYDFKQALDAQLRSRAEPGGGDLVRLRQRCVFERFLARLATTFGDRVILKGGVALTLRLPRVRVTRDLDLRVVGAPSRLLDDLVDAGQLAEGPDFFTFTVEPDPDHPTILAEGLAYGGERFRVAAELDGKIFGSRFGLDIVFADPMVRPPEILLGSDVFSFAGISPVSVRAYAREVHVAEKLHAFTMPRARPNSRIKDLPDLALLATTGPFESRALRETIIETYAQRATHVFPVELPEAPPGWETPYARMAHENSLRWASLAEVTEAVRAFLNPVLRGDLGVWSPDRWAWAPEHG